MPRHILEFVLAALLVSPPLLGPAAQEEPHEAQAGDPAREEGAQPTREEGAPSAPRTAPPGAKAPPAPEAASARPTRIPREVDLPFERLSDPHFSPDGGRIAFAGLDEDDHWHIHVVPIEGGAPRRLTSGTSDNRTPRFSFDGRMIAYVSRRDGQSDIWTVAVDGAAAPRQVTRTAAAESDPAWSPDGAAIAFSATGNDGAQVIWQVKLATGEAKRVSPGPGPDRSPAWSPDGKWIAYESHDAKGTHARIIAATGGETVRVGVPWRGEGSPSWSIDGRRLRLLAQTTNAVQIVDYPIGAGDVVTDTLPMSQNDRAAATLARAADRVAFIEPGRSEIRVIDFSAGGGAGKAVAEGGSINREPTWAPDGKHVIFVSDRHGQIDLYAVNISTGRTRRLTETPEQESDPDCSRASGDIVTTVSSPGGSAIWVLEPETRRTIPVTGERNDRHPSWSPDGLSIAYVSDSAGSPDIWIVKPGSGPARRFTTLPGAETHPAWSPAGDALIYESLRGGRSDIAQIPLAGGSETWLTPDADPVADRREPHWAASSAWIAYTHVTGEEHDLFIITPKGGKPFPYLRTAGTRETGPAWSPSGSHLAYASSRKDRLMVLDL